MGVKKKEFSLSLLIVALMNFEDYVFFLCFQREKRIMNLVPGLLYIDVMRRIPVEV